MRSAIRRVTGVVGAGLLLAALTAAPASAATDTININATNNVVTVPASTNVTLGDAVVFANTGAQSFQLFGDGSCAGTGTDYGTFAPGGALTDTGFVAPTYSVGQTLPFSVSVIGGSTCQPFSIVFVSSAPPPDVPEAPYAIALGGAAVALLGGGFFFVRRKRAHVA